MIITVTSGKGGTGKTLIATNQVCVIETVQHLDCAVEAPYAHLFPKVTKALVQGESIVRVSTEGVVQDIRELWDKINKWLVGVRA